MTEKIGTYYFKYEGTDKAAKCTTRFPLFKSEPSDIPDMIPIWPEGTPSFEPNANNEIFYTERSDEAYYRILNNTRIPGLYAYPVPQNITNTGRAIIICPGGGYEYLSIDQEGHDVARFFASNGISAFVLNYRMPAPDNRYGLLPDAPLNDAARAIRFVKANADKYGIKDQNVGIMGFSSGGHVAATVSTLYNDTTDATYPDISARPAFSILIYPVISLYEGYCHSHSRLRLLGLAPYPDLTQKYSAECNVTPDTPPAFLLTTEDDLVDCRNSFNYYLACRKANVPAELHAYPVGNHGYGMRFRGLGVDVWPDLVIAWLNHLGITEEQ